MTPVIVIVSGRREERRGDLRQKNKSKLVYGGLEIVFRGEHLQQRKLPLADHSLPNRF
jgi:hypothetical protein